ncbi:cache domain-containing sensor histidine kinase [Paenibacillus hexagrammi]|uniref:histidine kinase n=1 Tax=Paenibacillus hexagrammi TaxID=2908839 RepID=A0ABY3SFY8_9BACL|nr:sensor histidine kinase [Paenibacillus sp. YPD9-1]UJF32747.1 sensor histidine kinase [Paenibacillus sp. YPD9-1]
MRNNKSGVYGILDKFQRAAWFQLNNWPIRYKLIMHFLLISILPAICLGVLIAWATDNIIEKQVNDHTSQLIGNVNKSLEFYAGNLQNMTYFISFNPQIKRFLSSDVKQPESEVYDMKKFLQGFTTLYTEVAGILVVNAKGEYLSNEMYARSSRSLTEENWYKEAVEEKGIFKLIGHPSNRNVTTHVNYKDEDVVSVVRAILDPETQKVEGVVLIDLKLRVIAETVKDVRLGKSGYLTVIDDQGDSIYTPVHPIVSKLERAWIDEHPSGEFSKDIGGKQVQFIFRKSPFTNWTTVGVFSTKETVMEVREIRLYIICFIFVVCLLGIAASTYLSYTISKPIWQLMSFMRRAEDGNLSIRFKDVRQDEVGMLGRSFNAMLLQITKLIGLVEEEQRKKREAELRSLQAHIKPHFLYNTLDTIQWLSRKSGAHEVTEVVESLSRLFRIGLSKGNEIIPLEEEIAHIESYLKIQKTRYRDKLHYSLDIDPMLEGLYVLKVILQPIVENAIYHGIKERRGPGHIAIQAYLADERIQLEISDNGVGMSTEVLHQLRKSLGTYPQKSGMPSSQQPAPSLILPGDSQEELDTAKGYGIKNVQERIQLTYGASYGVHIDSEPGKGTKVTIYHPVIKRREAGRA